MGYRTIVIDPPWDVRRLASPGAKAFGAQTGTLKSVVLPYSTMSLDEIAALPVEDLAESDAHLYVWTINAYIDQAYDLVRGWGFKPRTLLTWVKAPMGIGPGGAFSQTTEHVLFARRGSLPSKRRFDTTWWNWPRSQHSAKPEAFFDIVEQVSPGPYAELFARRARLGWDYPIGDQALGGVAA
jgi:N6-adenosine-specific RNA methylase IME4